MSQSGFSERMKEIILPDKGGSQPGFGMKQFSPGLAPALEKTFREANPRKGTETPT